MYSKYAKHFKDHITEDIKRFAYDKALSNSRYMFVTNKDNRGYCTNCNREFNIGYHKHKSREECPYCGCDCEVRLTGIRRKTLIDSACFIRYDKSLVDKETLVARAFYVERDYRYGYKDVKTYIRELARYIYEPGNSVEFEKSQYDEKWYQRKSICRYNRDSLAKLNNYVDWDSLEEATKDNRFQYSMYEEYGFEDAYKSMTRYFDIYNRYPIIEKLTKIGFKGIVEYMLKGWDMEGAVNWKRKDDVFKFLKLNRAQVKEIVQSEVEITPKLLNMYRQGLKEKWKLNLNEIVEVKNLFISAWRRKEIGQYTNLGKAFRYVTKQFNTYTEHYDNKADVIRTWIDYLFDCDNLKLDYKNDSKLLFPKNVHQQHLNFTAQIKYLEDKKLIEGFEKERSRREKLKFEYKNLICFAAMSQKELIEEGKAMNHCVGGYAKSCSEGKTDIIFIRSKDEPNKSYVTMEVIKDKVIQVRAHSNKKPPEEVNEFVEEYKKQILSKIKSKKGKKVA